MADAVEFADDRLLGQVEDLDLGCLVVVDGQSESELEGFGASAFAVLTAGEIAQFNGNVVRSGLLSEAEGLGLAVNTFGPQFVELEGLVAQQSKTNRGARSNF